MQQVGVDRVIQYAKRMGITEPLGEDLSLALGTSVVSPLDMASGYATLANGGVHVAPTALRVVRDSLGSTLLDHTYPQETEVVSSATAYVVTSMLESVIKNGTGYPNAVIGRAAAGKTGTTSDFHDAWFVGYTADDLVAAVWVGNDDNHAMEESYGGNVPAKTWAYFMKHALEKTPKREFPIPTGDVKVMTLCSTGRKEVFVTGTEPQGDDCTPRRRARYESNSLNASATATSQAAVPVVTAPPAAPTANVPATPMPGDPGDPIEP